MDIRIKIPCEVKLILLYLDKDYYNVYDTLIDYGLNNVDISMLEPMSNRDCERLYIDINVEHYIKFKDNLHGISLGRLLTYIVDNNLYEEITFVPKNKLILTNRYLDKIKDLIQHLNSNELNEIKLFTEGLLKND